jgi:UDP-N-acetylmuramoyl-L-alanyl-D-glutamate--2,6-diaminopimelate ligase
VRKGDLFIALNGYSFDGYAFIKDAIARGAAAVAAEKDFDTCACVKKIKLDDTREALPAIAANFYGHPSSGLNMVGITGTNGKTTVTYIVEKILEKARKPCGVIGTINYRYRDKVLPAKNTTPGPLELQSILSDMLKKKVRYAVMEVSSHSLDQRRVDCVSFDIAIFTNITPEHLDYHGTMKEYFNAKIKIFDKMKRGGTAILNYDDRRVMKIARSVKGKKLTYGIGCQADVRAEKISLSLDGTNFNAITPAGDFAVSTGLIGMHNVSNMLAGIAVAFVEGIAPRTVKRALAEIETAPGRLERVPAGQPFKIFVDFAHTEDALNNVLQLLKEVAPGNRIITVFGCGGNRDRSKRPLMGKAACRFSDKVIITSDNPRYEDPKAILQEIEGGVKGLFSNYDIVSDRREAIKVALERAEADDIVLIAGKGHEKYQILGDEVLPFDDCQVARQILNSRRRPVREVTP